MRMFLLFKSRGAIAGFLVTPPTILSEWRCARPVKGGSGGREAEGEGGEGKGGEGTNDTDDAKPRR